MISFQEYSGDFVGLQNYIQVFQQERLFWLVFKNTIFWVLGTLVIQYFMGLSAALLLNQNIKGEKIFMSILLFPWITSLVASTLAWRWMLDSEFGIINKILFTLGLIDANHSWLSNPSTTLFILIIINAWCVFPFTMMTLSAGLKTLSHDINDAAKIDGVNALQNLIYITLPQLMPITTVVLLYVVVWSLSSFTIPYLMTGGGPLNSTLIIALYINRLVFRDLKLNIASSVSVVIMIFSLIVTSVYLKAMRRGGGV
jgi:multiple sugar transport system permease protein